MKMDWEIYGSRISSRLILGTARYPSPKILRDAIVSSATEIVTVSLRRQSPESQGGTAFWDIIKESGVRVLPNTAGCRTAIEAITTAHLARDLFDTRWIKLEVIGNEYRLAPDPFELLIAARELTKEGFQVFPYTTDDIVVAERLLEAGCRVLMPWASPIGTGQGLRNVESLRALRNRFKEIPLIVDAGIGKPSDAARALELGYDGVLLNTAIALATDPCLMARAFREAVISGRTGYLAGLMPERDIAVPSTPTVGTPFWQLPERKP
jgi:thiazole synthase